MGTSDRIERLNAAERMCRYRRRQRLRHIPIPLHVQATCAARGDRTGALAAYEESLAIMRKLTAADPGNAGWQRDVSVSLTRVVAG